MVRGGRGYTLVEVVVSLAIFGTFLFILTSLTLEMNGQDKRYPVNFMRHPQVASVLSRMRKDVVDAHAPGGANPYRETYQAYTNGPQVLILESVQSSGFVQTVVWDLRTQGQARRRAYSAGAQVSDWVANGVPEIKVSTFELADRPYGVRIRATDERGMLAIDQIYQPRSHQ